MEVWQYEKSRDGAEVLQVKDRMFTFGEMHYHGDEELSVWINQVFLLDIWIQFFIL